MSDDYEEGASLTQDRIAAALTAIYLGKLVECTKDDYESFLRSVLQDKAGEWIDTNQVLRAQIALNEVKRLDKKFSFKME